MPSRFIAALDNALLQVGTHVKISRPSVDDSEITVPANVRSGVPVETDTGIAQITAWIILSPTELVGQAWPDGDIFDMPTRNDKITYDGRVRNIEMVRPFHSTDGELVRIEIGVTG